MNKKVIEITRVRMCENSDQLAPIDKEGLALLMDDGTTQIVWSNGYCPECELASDEEKQAFRAKHGMLDVGDTIQVIRSRTIKVGTVGRIIGFSRYEVPGTYGRAQTTYVNFRTPEGEEMHITIVNVAPVINGEVVKLDHRCVQFSGRFMI